MKNIWAAGLVASVAFAAVISALWWRGRRGVERDQANPPLAAASRQPMDMLEIPEALHPLVPVIQQWSAVTSTQETLAVVDYAEQSDARIAQLEAWAALWTPELNALAERWEDELPMTESYERRKFYFIFVLFDKLEIDFPQLRKPRDVIQESISNLQVLDTRAARATRMWAARELCDFAGEAGAAIPALTAATKDSSDEVRAWSHAALASITGNREQHREAIRAILDNADLDEGGRLSITEALRDLGKTSTQRAVSRLRSAAITNDPVELRRLVSRVNVNTIDHNGSTAVQYAVASNHAEALEILLAAGADANQRSPVDQQTLLHKAAVRRRGDVMIRALLQYHANPHAVDSYGKTPLDIAREKRRTKSIALLKAAMR